MKQGISRQNTGDSAGYSLRFIITCRGSNIDLIRIKQIRSIAPPSDNIDQPEMFCGSWIELRRIDGTILYLKRIHESFDGIVEVLTGRQREELAWESVPELEKTIVIIIPQIPEADHLAFMTRRPDANDKGVVEIARFPVKK